LRPLTPPHVHMRRRQALTTPLTLPLSLPWPRCPAVTGQRSAAHPRTRGALFVGANVVSARSAFGSRSPTLVHSLMSPRPHHRRRRPSFQRRRSPTTSPQDLHLSLAPSSTLTPSLQTSSRPSICPRRRYVLTLTTTCRWNSLWRRNTDRLSTHSLSPADESSRQSLISGGTSSTSSGLHSCMQMAAPAPTLMHTSRSSEASHLTTLCSYVLLCTWGLSSNRWRHFSTAL